MWANMKARIFAGRGSNEQSTGIKLTCGRGRANGPYWRDGARDDVEMSARRHRRQRRWRHARIRRVPFLRHICQALQACTYILLSHETADNRHHQHVSSCARCFCGRGAGAVVVHGGVGMRGKVHFYGMAARRSRMYVCMYV